MTQDEKFMKHAMTRAKAAAALGEIPIGAVIVKDGKIVSSGKNMREIKAIDRACKRLGAWRLCDCTLYVTLEPCPMCAGAIINSRISRVVFGAYDSKAGAFGSVMDMNSFALNHKCEVEGGVLESDCAALLSGFFSDLRKKKSKLRE